MLHFFFFFPAICFLLLLLNFCLNLFLLIEYREAFKCFDLNENGTLSTKELKYAMRMLGSNPTDSQVQDLVNAKDFDGRKCACAAVEV